MWRQGDIFIMRATGLPEEARTRAVPGATLAHGEVTGHSHRVEDPATVLLYAGAMLGEFFLDVIAPRARIVHEEHGPIDLDRGVYRVWRQREYSPQAIRYVSD